MEPITGFDQRGSIDDARLRRLRWRARRGLLENDLVLERFFARHGDQLDEAMVAGLDQLLDLPDNELLDLLLERSDGASLKGGSETQRVLEMLRRC
ncbi:MAG: succinate dehydrogenase assembly factor 2 [Betaproteobacteria bacterium]